MRGNDDSLTLGTGYSISSIVFPENGKFRSRKVISRSNSRPTIKYPSWKNHRMIYCESKHELDACFLLDSDKSTQRFYEQPCCINYINSLGEKFKHYPDFLIYRNSGLCELWEVKPDLELEDNDVFLRESVLKGPLYDLGYEYRLICGRSIRYGEKLNNAKYLVRNGRKELSLEDFNLAVVFFQEVNPQQWGEFRPFSNIIKCNRTLCRLILEGYVECDTEEKITNSTKIYWKYNSIKEEI